MARGMNRATIIGFVEREPEVRCAADGQSVASFPVSTRRRWTTNAGETRESTEWFNVVAWGRMAEIAGRYLSLNQRLFAEGHLQTRSWEDASGQRQVRTELVAGRLIPMGGMQPALDGSGGGGTEDESQCLNRVSIIGNLGRDPEMRYTPGGQAVTWFSLAATRSWSTTNGDRREVTEWFNVAAWGSLAEICHQHLSKGRRVYVEGELRTRVWEQPEGTRHHRTELVANEMIMLGPRPGHDANDEQLASGLEESRNTTGAREHHE